jgi:predicted FMN-binding regulatory protein PaiB
LKSVFLPVDRFRQDPFEATSRTVGEFHELLSEALEKQIVGFRITVERWKGKWKLNQNQSLVRRRLGRFPERH